MGIYKIILKEANYLLGNWVSTGESMHSIHDKYSAERIATVPFATPGEVADSISFATSGRRELAEWSAGKRAQHLDRVADLLEAKRDAFVDLIVREAGKPIFHARNEVDRGMTTLRNAAAEATRFCGEIIPMDQGIGVGKTAFTKRVPVGIVAAITPYNFPLNLVLHKLAPALAVGCPVILKPALQSPLTSFAIAALVEEAGYPKEALQVFVCCNSSAERLVRDERVAMLSFTGSDEVGWKLKSIAGKKKVTLELGGNAAMIVDETADIGTAAALACMGSYLYAGQICVSTQRIFAVKSVFEEFKAAMIKEIAFVKSGNPREEGVINGPLIDKAHAERVNAWVQEAIQQGAELLAGAKTLDPQHSIYAPTLLTKTLPSMKVRKDEIFGPVAVLEPVDDYQEAILKVNESRFGLQVGVFTNRVDRMHQAHDQLEVGGVIIGGIPGFRVENMPYGGIKDSGLGREGIRYAMEEMTEPRLMVF
jgi:acyl-CoA reductase-like NAD-dependent aldehyde dehydrogenase